MGIGPDESNLVEDQEYVDPKRLIQPAFRSLHWFWLLELHKIG
jgi:hypothetical protein